MATEKSLRSKVATWGDAYKGIPEGGTKHKELVDMFNDSGKCTRYKMTLSDPWCAMFVSDAFIANNLTNIFPCVECSCDAMISLAKSAGIWVEDDSYVPGIADICLYDWDDSGKGDCTGSADHVGIVQSVSGSSFTVIEGNKSDSVGVRTMSIDGRYIRGFITPNYASAASSSSNSTSTASKTIDELANEVIVGKWGNGTERQVALESAGYDYNAVQARVNELMGSGSSSSSKSSSSSSSSSSGIASASKFESGYSSGKKYKVTAINGLNLRKGPSTKYDVIKSMICQASVYYYGYYDKDSSGDKWLLVIADGVTGWANAKYLA